LRRVFQPHGNGNPGCGPRARRPIRWRGALGGAGALALAVLTLRREALPARRDLVGLACVALGVVFGFPLCSAVALRSVPAAHALGSSGSHRCHGAICRAAQRGAARERILARIHARALLCSRSAARRRLCTPLRPMAGCSWPWCALLLATVRARGWHGASAAGAWISWALVLSLPLSLGLCALALAQRHFRQRSALRPGSASATSLWSACIWAFCLVSRALAHHHRPRQSGAAGPTGARAGLVLATSKRARDFGHADHGRLRAAVRGVRQPSAGAGRDAAKNRRSPPSRAACQRRLVVRATSPAPTPPKKSTRCSPGQRCAAMVEEWRAARVFRFTHDHRALSRAVSRGSRRRARRPCRCAASRGAGKDAHVGR